MRAVRNTGMRGKKIKRRLNDECACVAVRLFAACLGKHRFILLQAQNGVCGEGGVCRVQNMAAFVHTTAITQHPASTNRQYTSSTYHRHTVRGEKLTAASSHI